MLHFGGRLRSARERARLTQEELGTLIGYSRTAISRLESNPDPRLSPRLLCRLSEVLDASTTSLLGQVTQKDDQEDPVKRRQLFQAAGTATVAAVAPPPLPGRVGATEIAGIEHGIADLRALDQRVGADRLGTFAARLVGDVERLLAGSYRPDASTRLHALLGQACVLAGWIAQDTDNSDQAARYYHDAMAAAALAEDPLLTAHACNNLSFLTARTGQPARAVDYARAGQRAAQQGGGGPRLRALLLAREASGHALLADAGNAGRALGQALTAYGSGHGHDPAWTAFVTDEALAGWIGVAHSRLGQHGPGLRQLTAAARMQGWPRNAVGWQVRLAEGHAAAGDPAHAAVLAARTLPAVTDLSSTRIRSRVRTLSATLAEHAQVPEVREFHDQARTAGLAA
jgi:transcriptional regulator with XRE-family HTH domain